MTTGIAGRILNPRSQDWELKNRCDYSSKILKRRPLGAFRVTGLPRPAPTAAAQQVGRPLRLGGAARVAEGLTTMDEVLACTPPVQ